MKKITIKSPAKINLTLDVFSKNEGDVFHEIKTIFHRIDFGDRIEISTNHKFEIVGDFDFPTENNLIFKAWKLIEKFVDPKNFHPVKVLVAKNIPQGGGLGGGSSNFANFIKGYFQLFGLGAIPTELVTTSAKHGKDIPFFFCKERCAVGTHFGEVITKTPFAHDRFYGKRIYLYIPKFESHTEDMYKTLTNFDTSFTDQFLQNPNLENCGNGFNEFLKDEKYQKILSPCVLLSTPYPLISGSGSCFFSFEKLEVVGCREIVTVL